LANNSFLAFAKGYASQVRGTIPNCTAGRVRSPGCSLKWSSANVIAAPDRRGTWIGKTLNICIQTAFTLCGDPQTSFGRVKSAQMLLIGSVRDRQAAELTA
jgi:hypothetical protein